MRRAKLAVVVPIVWAAAALSGSAYGYWVVAGTGSTETAAATMDAPAPAATVGEPAAALYPGGDGALVLEVHNTNGFAVVVASLAAGAEAATADPAACAAFVSVNAAAVPPTTAIEPDATVTITVPGAVHLDAAVPSACQGATFTIPLLVTVQR